LLGLLLLTTVAGCAAFHPVPGIPASYLPEEFAGPSRSGKKTIHLGLLVQRQPDQYRVAAGDILSVYVPGVIGTLRFDDTGAEVGENPPINLPQSPDDPPTIGYPVAIRDDGTVSLPLVQPIRVQGLTLGEVEESLRRAYTEQADILNPELDRVLVSLARRREYRVLVVRQETSNDISLGTQPGAVNIGKSKRGTASIVRLPAYENDVLHALARAQAGADGLPGLDAENTIYIIRRNRSRPTSGIVTAPAAAPALPAPTPIRSSNGSSSAPKLPGTQSTSPADRNDDTPAPDSRKDADDRSSADAQRRSAEPGPSGSTGGAAGTDPATPPVRGYDVPPRQPRTPAIAPLPTTRPDDRPLPGQLPRQAEPSTGPKPEPSIWPPPARPPSSIQRTSQQGVPAVWGHSTRPLVRSQSPQGITFGWGGSVPIPSAWPATNAPLTIPAPSSGMLAPGMLPPGMASLEMHSPGEGLVPACDPMSDLSESSWFEELAAFDPTVDNPNVVKIPIRLSEGERPNFTEEDIVLGDGDIVFIESRETEVFYTGGLLGGGQYTLPRDYDLGVLEAISIAQSPQSSQQGSTRSIGGVSALNQDVTISASHVVILRQLPNGARIPIEVDLYRALRRPEVENILVQPGDLILLQYTKLEAIGAFIERNLLEGAIFGLAATLVQPGGGGN
jgi:hypothetical protein